MSSTVLVVAPHPDDETLGCGGTLLRHAAQGDAVHWIIATEVSEARGYTPERIRQEEEAIQEIAERFGFTGVHSLDLTPSGLDAVPMGEIVGKMGAVFREVEPEVVYIPYRHDVHTDHAAVFDAAVACTKWFRYPSVRRVLVYETPSETDFNLNPDVPGFRPSVFVDITDHLDGKVEAMQIFASEMGEHPFPRNERVLRALAHLRGAASGYEAAEAFMLLRERI